MQKYFLVLAVEHTDGAIEGVETFHTLCQTLEAAKNIVKFDAEENARDYDCESFLVWDDKGTTARDNDGFTDPYTDFAEWRIIEVNT